MKGIHRIDSTDALESDGKTFFTEGTGSSSSDAIATTVKADWLNGIQEGLCSVFEEAGINPDASQVSLFTDAIKKIIENETNYLDQDINLIYSTILQGTDRPSGRPTRSS